MQTRWLYQSRDVTGGDEAVTRKSRLMHSMVGEGGDQSVVKWQVIIASD